MTERTFVSIVEALLPSASTGPVGPSAAEVWALMSPARRRLPPVGRLAFGIAGVIAMVAPLVYAHSARSFSTLPIATRRDVLTRWGASRVPLLRDCIALVRALTFAVYYDDPRVTRAIGWHIDEHVAQVNAVPPVAARSTRLPEVRT